MSWDNGPDVVFQKKRFAKALTRSITAFEAAQQIFKDDTGRALQISTEWATDPIVIEEYDRLVAEAGPDGFKPSRGEVLKQLWAHATSAPMAKDRNQALEIIAKIEGWIVPPSKAVGDETVGVPTTPLYMPYPKNLPEKVDV